MRLLTLLLRTFSIPSFTIKMNLPISVQTGKRWIVFLSFFLPSVLHAGNPAAPDDAAVEGSLGGAFGSAITAQMNYVEADLSNLRQGDVITGISFRLNDDQGSFSGMTFSRFEIRVGKGNDSLTTTFANNFVGAPKLVRSGSLTFVPSDFTFGGSPNSFGRVIKFDVPWVYDGGNLLMEVRSSTPTATLTIDTMTDSEGVDGEATFATNADATTATTAIFAHNWAIAFEVTDVSMATEKIAIPEGFVGSEGNSSINITIPGGHALQTRYLREHLGDLTSGDKIVGMGYRLNSSISAFNSVTFSRFEVAFGRASAGFTGASSQPFLDNYASPRIAVRTGPGTFFATAISDQPNPFMDRPLRFEEPFTYTGGDLLVELRAFEGSGPFLIDSYIENGLGGFAISDGNHNGTVSLFDLPNGSIPLELHVVRDTRAPRIKFSGKKRLKRGTNRVRGTILEAGTVASVQYRSTSGQKGKFSTRSAAHPFLIKVRNKGTKRKIVVKVNATDASGNRSFAKRVLK